PVPPVEGLRLTGGKVLRIADAVPPERDGEGVTVAHGGLLGRVPAHASRGVRTRLERVPILVDRPLRLPTSERPGEACREPCRRPHAARRRAIVVTHGHRNLAVRHRRYAGFH